MSENKKRYTYGSKQRLKSTRTIDLLFKEGKSMQQYPVRLMWLIVNNENKLQVSVAASKRVFAKAVHRNRIKRHLREAWRLQKNDIEFQLESMDISVAAMIVFTGKELKDIFLIPSAVEKILGKLAKNLQR